MKYNPNIHNRKSIRLKGYDYSQAGLYFITICVDRRRNPYWWPFGNIVNGEMVLNDAGKMVENEWLKLSERFTNIKLHEFVVMPNHFHAIMEIDGGHMIVPNGTGETNISGQPPGTGQPKTVGDMVGAFQSIVTVEYIRGVKNLGWHPFNGKLWQRNYWEHIIRDEQSYQRIAEYIINNLKNWDNDKLNKQ